MMIRPATAAEQRQVEIAGQSLSEVAYGWLDIRAMPGVK